MNSDEIENNIAISTGQKLVIAAVSFRDAPDRHSKDLAAATARSNLSLLKRQSGLSPEIVQSLIVSQDARERLMKQYPKTDPKHIRIWVLLESLEVFDKLCIPFEHSYSRS